MTECDPGDPLSTCDDGECNAFSLSISDLPRFERWPVVVAADVEGLPHRSGDTSAVGGWSSWGCLVMLRAFFDEVFEETEENS